MLCRYSMYSTVLSHIDTNIYHKNEECYLNVIQHVKAEYEMQLLKLITYVVDIILNITNYLQHKGTPRIANFNNCHFPTKRTSSSL